MGEKWAVLGENGVFFGIFVELWGGGTATRTYTDEHRQTRTLRTPLRGGNRGTRGAFLGRSRALSRGLSAAADAADVAWKKGSKTGQNDEK
jgi:hypothetical protein